MPYRLKLRLSKKKYVLFLVIILIIEICFLIPKINKNLNFNNQFSTENSKTVIIFRFYI